MNNKHKGFTIAELLVVVAIIAVLIGVAIPILNKQLERSREAYDIYTMRQAASAATELFYMGIHDNASATAAGLKWWDNTGLDGDNAAGIYDPGSGRFLPKGSKDGGFKAYGKGTKMDGGTRYTLGNERGSYLGNLDYRDAVVMISIYPYGKPHIDVYWKYVKAAKAGTEGTYVGGQQAANDPKYSIRIYLD